MKKLFRWFALALLVGAMGFAGLGSASAEDEADDRAGPCGYLKNGNTSMALVSYCNPCPQGVQVTVTALGGSVKALVCTNL